MTVPIGLQLFAVRAEAEKDLGRAIEQSAACGYAGVEPWGYDGTSDKVIGRPASEVRSMLEANGLACCGIHMAPGAIEPANLERTIEVNKTLGCRFLIVAADSRRMASPEGVTELAALLNATAERLATEGMYTGYHAHGFDFVTLANGQIAWNMLFSSTRPEVIMQIDIGNSVSGGGDPIAALRNFPNRARSVHLKDFGGPPDSVIGEGKADWKEIFRLCDTTQNTEWYVVEEGSSDGSGFDIPRRSLEALKRMGR